MICMDAMEHPKKLACGHAFCRKCIEEYFKVIENVYDHIKAKQCQTLFLWLCVIISGWIVRCFHILSCNDYMYVGSFLYHMLPRHKICYHVALVYWYIL